MTFKRRKFAAAVTLVEVMVAMAVLAIAAIGALGYQYYAAGQARIAQAQTTATRAAQLLLEDWKSTGGSSDYDPTSLGLGFSSDLPMPQSEAYHLPDGVYSATVDGVPMMVVLNWADVAHDSVAEVTLRQLTVGVLWTEELDKNDDNLGQITSAEVSHAGDDNDYLRTLVTLTTYVRLDASGG